MLSLENLKMKEEQAIFKSERQRLVEQNLVLTNNEVLKENRPDAASTL